MGCQHFIISVVMRGAKEMLVGVAYGLTDELNLTV